MILKVVNLVILKPKLIEDKIIKNAKKRSLL
jgi:hypothetical protein